MHGLPVQTRSLLLRHFVREDALPILALNAESTTRHWIPSHVYADAAEACSKLALLISAYSDPADPRHGPYVLAVEHAGTRQLLGHVGFSPLHGEVEVSYAIAESHRGQGLGAEALSRATDWVTQTFGLSSVVAVTAVTNAPSRRALDRSGYVHVRDELMRFQGVTQPVSRYCRPSSGGRSVA